MKASHAFAAVALFGLGYVTSAHVNKIDGNPIKAKDESFVLKNNGTVETGGAISRTSYNFKDSIRWTYYFGLRSHGFDLKGIGTKEFVRMVEIQEQACALADDRPGYRDVCIVEENLQRGIRNHKYYSSLPQPDAALP